MEFIMDADPNNHDPISRLSQIDLSRLPPGGGDAFNRLIFEKSPYLLQHAENPLDWYPWGEDAFERARREDKPVFLSIGYSSCHWCHVMAHESFEDPEVAEVLNRHFICIKVDREERPDIDETYMTVCQMLTGSGGWPLSLLLAPDGKPFFAATYLPKQSRGGAMGLIDLAQRVSALWQSDRKRITEAGEQIHQSLLHLDQGEGREAALEPSSLEVARSHFERVYDAQHGGFGRAPKFPTAHNLSLLLRIGRRFDDTKAREMALHTLKRMRMGGLFDQIGFGFHRYSVDERWRVPHFEKMLYDQAMAALAYLDAWQSTGDFFYGRTAGEILDYVARNLKHSEGAFCCGEDADSEGAEGTFYLWSQAEIEAILGAEQGGIFCRAYSVSEEGNFEGKNILHLESDRAQLAQDLAMPQEKLDDLLEDARRRLLAVRERRVRPHRDDKVLAGWNGLIIAALARGGALLENAELVSHAAQAADFILDRLRDEQGRLLRRYREGEAAIPAFLEDYSFLVFGLTELYQAAFNPGFLTAALDLNREMLRLFSDDSGDLYDTGADAEIVLRRGRSRHDGALPSGSSVAVLNLLRLARLSGEIELEERGERLLERLLPMAEQNPQAFGQLLIALDYALGPRQEVVICVPEPDVRPQEMLAVLRQKLRPATLVLLQRPDDAKSVPPLAPLSGKHVVDGQPTAWVCRDQSCREPVTSVGALGQILDG
jgi:uncharacterized protein YyaL (SSP411 family)